MLTSLLGPKVFGMLALSLTLAGIGNLLFYGPFSQAVLRFYSIFLERRRLEEYFGAIFRFHKVTALGIVGTAIFLSAGTLGWFGLEISELVLFSTLFMVTSGIVGTYIAIQNAIGNHRIVATVQVMDAWLRIIFALAGITFLNVSATSALGGYALAGLCMVLFFWICNRKQILEWRESTELRTSVAALNELIFYAFPFFLFALVGIVTSFGDRWMINFCCGLEEVGIYAALYQIAYAPLVIFSNTINQVILPVVYVRAGEGAMAENIKSAQQTYWRMVFASALCLFGWVALTFFLGQPLLRILTTPQFAEKHDLFLLLAIGGAVFYFGQILVTRGLYELQPQRYVFPKVIYAASFVLISWLLVDGHGMYGVAIASLLGSIVYVCAVLYANAFFPGADARWGRFSILARAESGKP